MKEYTVKSVICDYGVFENEEMLIICNSQANAKLIADILNADSKHEVYKHDITEQIGDRVEKVIKDWINKREEAAEKVLR